MNEVSNTNTSLDKVQSETESIVQSFIQSNTDIDTNKARYLGYRASGFELREALQMVGIHEKTLRRWRDADQKFAQAESNLPSIRKDLSTEFAHMEFMRNFRLVLQKDYEVISRSLDKSKLAVMSKEDYAYLIKARGHYTPQQLSAIRELLSGNGSTKNFNFTDFILSVNAQRGTVNIAARRYKDEEGSGVSGLQREEDAVNREQTDVQHIPVPQLSQGNQS